VLQVRALPGAPLVLNDLRAVIVERFLARTEIGWLLPRLTARLWEAESSKLLTTIHTSFNVPIQANRETGISFVCSKYCCDHGSMVV
jgi:hypothetical protein